MEHVLLALGEDCSEREHRIRHLFSYFDSANTGLLDYSQVERGLSNLNIPSEYKYAKDLLNVCDSDKDGRVDYQEFKKYIDEKELELYQLFRHIDSEHNGCILSKDLHDAVIQAGIKIDDNKLACFVEKVDKDNNGIITFEEWRDFLLFYPHQATVENIYYYLDRICPVDVGEQAVIPEGIGKRNQAYQYLIAGGVAGAASRTATAPLDRLKVKLQVQTSQARIFPSIRNIWIEGGILGFFRGNGLNVLKVIPESAIRFYTYEMLKKMISKSKQGDKVDIGAAERLLSGGLAGAIAQTAIYPLDLVKTRLQTHAGVDGRCPTVRAISRGIWIHEGPMAFYKGLIPSLIGIIPYAGIDLAAYETLKETSKKYILHDNEPGPFVQLCCGTLSGALGATCVYPLQVVRTRMQAQHLNSESAASCSMSGMFRRTYKHEGIRGFYKGLFPNLLKVVPSASITYLVYEAMKKRFQLD